MQKGGTLMEITISFDGKKFIVTSPNGTIESYSFTGVRNFITSLLNDLEETINNGTGWEMGEE